MASATPTPMTPFAQRAHAPASLEWPPPVREAAGAIAGMLVAPVVGAVSWLRGARMFHPDGVTFRGRVDRHPACPADFIALAERLCGPALARFSAALWRRGFEHLDVLGVALRFLPDVRDESAEGAQDLLFATIRSPFTLASAPLTTDAGDYFANRYWAVSPFDVGHERHAKFRLVSTTRPAPYGGRERSLRSAVARGEAIWQLHVRHVFARRYVPLATLTLEVETPTDQSKLRFSPFNCARGVVPRGFVHAMRHAPYAASQAGRAIAAGR